MIDEHDDEHPRPPGGEDFDEIRPEDLPPPSTFAGRAGQEPAPSDEDDEFEIDVPEIGDGLDEEFSLEEAPEPEELPPSIEELAPRAEEPDATVEAAPPPPIEQHPTVEADIEAMFESDDPPPAQQDGSPTADGPEEPAPTVEAPPPVTPPPTEEDEELAGGGHDDEYQPHTDEEELPHEIVKPAPYAVSRAGALVPSTALGDDPAGDKSPPKLRLWPRFLAGSLVVVISFATATAVTALLYLTDIAEGLGGLPEVKRELVPYQGGPQTFLLLGSDARSGEEQARSDTTMILRVDPDPPAVRLFSLPRDLEVNIPGHGVDKLNAAYSIGGPELTLKTVKALTGIDFNHVVNVDFQGFADAVNAIECVLIDVDRHYLNETDSTYSKINIPAGYQQLCGLNALQYVRYRHTDNDVYRASRQQIFIREARAKLGFERLFNDRKLLLDIFTDNTESSIEDPIVLLELIKLLLEVREAPVQQIPFEGDLGDATSTYVTATNEQIRTAVDALISDEPGDAREGPGPEGGSETKGDGGGKGGGGKNDPPEPEPVDAGDAEMFDSVGAADFFAPAIEEGLAKDSDSLSLEEVEDFEILLPTQIVGNAQYSDSTRGYEIVTYDGAKYPAYRMVAIIAGGIEEFYGVQGVRWLDPPILDAPHEAREVNGRSYDFYYGEGRLRMIAWQEGDWTYWVANTLRNTLSEEQMIATLESLKEY